MDLEKGGNYGGSGSNRIHLDSKLATYVSNDLPSFFNFSDVPPLVIANLANKDGEYSFTYDSKHFTNIIILAIDSTGATQRLVDVEKDNDAYKLKTRKIELDKPLNKETCYQETRNAVCLTPKDKHIIEDITSVDYQTVDSIQKVGQVLQELLKLKHQEHQPLTTTSWLYNWNNTDMEFKNKKYSLFMSNEFNIFLYFKDQEYFEEVVRPSVAAKIEKTLIDYFLLEEYEKFEEFKHVSVYDSFSALEQCLLIAVINMKHPETAKLLADQFKHKAKLVETKTNKKNQKFDTVLLMKIMEADEAEEEGEEILKEGAVMKSSIKKEKKSKVKRQRSMSCSSNSSVEEMNWAIKRSYASDISDNEEDDYGEGECGEDDEESFDDYQNE